MSEKAKISAAQKEAAVKDYLAGKYTLRQIAAQYNIHHSNISKWLLLYQNWGAEGLQRPKRNTKYPDELKEEVVRAYKTKNYSLYDLCRKYKIRNFSVIQTWILKAEKDQ